MATFIGLLCGAISYADVRLPSLVSDNMVLQQNSEVNIWEWANINVDLYSQPAEVLAQAVIDKRNRAGKKGFAFEISEDMPTNYAESIPVVLKTLREID